jgi:hypothetical protein
MKVPILYWSCGSCGVSWLCYMCSCSCKQSLYCIILMRFWGVYFIMQHTKLPRVGIEVYWAYFKIMDIGSFCRFQQNLWEVLRDALEVHLGLGIDQYGWKLEIVTDFGESLVSKFRQTCLMVYGVYWEVYLWLYIIYTLLWINIAEIWNCLQYRISAEPGIWFVRYMGEPVYGLV